MRTKDNLWDDHTRGLGTPIYISPEQEYTNKYDSKTDLYSLGIMMFELFYEVQTISERIFLLQLLRSKDRRFPEDFDDVLA